MRSCLAFLLLLLTAALPAQVTVSGPITLRGTVGVPLVATILASGGAPLTYGAITLPAGLTLNSATGRITGTPTAAGSFTVTLTADGGAAGSASTSLSFTVDAASGPAVVNAGQWAVSADSTCSLQLLAGATATGFSAVGQPDALMVSTEGLLAGLASTVGLYNVEVSANNGATATTLLLEVLPAQVDAPAFTVPAQPLATVGAPFAAFLSASGATSFTCTALPAWLTLDSTNGLLRGTPPNATTSANLRLTATKGGLSASTVLAIPVAVPVAGDPVPASPPVIEATVSSGLGWKASASAAATWSALGLPAGLALDAASGQLTGTPAEAGNFSVVVTATPVLETRPMSTTVALRVRAKAIDAPQLVALVPPVLTVGAPAVIAVLTAGGTPTTYAATGAADFAIDSRGLLSGTPAAAGLQAVTLSVSNANGTAVATLLLQSGARLAAAPLPTAPVSFHATAGSRFAAALVADTAVTTWIAIGLPAEIALAPATGRITGLAAAGTSNVFLSASDADGSNPTHGAFTAVAATIDAPVISDVGPWLVGAGQPVRLLPTADDATSWTITGLPTGLSASSGGLISGSTSLLGERTLNLVAANDAGQTRTAGLLVVEASPAGAPVFSDPGVLVGEIDVPFTGHLTASLSPIEYAISGGPAWLTVVPATGALSGLPTATGTWILGLSARNAAGTSRTVAVLRVDPTPIPPAAPVSHVSGGGCGGGAAGLLIALLGAGLVRIRRPSPPPRATPRR